MLHETNASHLPTFLTVVSSGLAMLAHENMSGADTA